MLRLLLLGSLALPLISTRAHEEWELAPEAYLLHLTENGVIPKEDAPEPAKLEIKWDGRVYAEGNLVFKPETSEFTELNSWLAELAKKGTSFQPEGAPKGVMHCKEPLRIRADSSADATLLSIVIGLCRAQEPMLSNLQLGVLVPTGGYDMEKSDPKEDRWWPNHKEGYIDISLPAAPISEEDPEVELKIVLVKKGEPEGAVSGEPYDDEKDLAWVYRGGQVRFHCGPRRLHSFQAMKEWLEGLLKTLERDKKARQTVGAKPAPGPATRADA